MNRNPDLTLADLRSLPATYRRDGRRYGRTFPTAEERFWTNVPVIRHPDECWEWTGARRPQGYGLLAVRGTARTAHRVSYVLHHGEIPPGLVVMHSCDNPPCVNPSHLSVGTHRDNSDDKVAKGRASGAKGLANYRGKLTDDQVAAIRAARDAGDSLSAIAAVYGIDKSHVSRIASGQRRAA